MILFCIFKDNASQQPAMSDDISSPPSQKRKTDESSELAVPMPSSPTNPASQGDMFATSPPSRRATGELEYNSMKISKMCVTA